MRTRRILLGSVVALALLVVAVLLAAHFASRSESVLRWVVAQAAQRLPGTLTITGLRGAFDRPIHIESLDYQSDTLRLHARGIDLDWSALELVIDRALRIDRLSVAELDLQFPARGPRRALPADLRPPFPVRAKSVEIGRLRLHAGPTPVQLSAIAFSLDASDAVHALQLTRLQSPWGRAAGRLRMSTAQPFALQGDLHWEAATPAQWPVRTRIDLDGTLEQLRFEGRLSVRDAGLPVQGLIAPFAPAPLVRASAQASAFDLSQWFPQLPATSIDARISAGGAPLRGTLELTNARPGTLDVQRLPLDRLAAALALEGRALVLNDLRADLAGAGGAHGRVTLDADGIDAHLQLLDVNLRGLHRALRPTALRGTLAVRRHGTRDEFDLDVRERGMRLSGRATLADGLLDVHQALLQAGPGSVQAQGRLALGGERAFSLSARLARLDPAQLGAFASARIDGDAQIEGRLAPQWLARTRFTLRDSLWRGHRLSGGGRAELSPQRAREVDARLALGRNVLHAQGAFGATGDRLRFSLQAPALGALGRGWDGSAHAQGTLGGSLAQPTLEASANARELQLPGGQRAAALTLEVDVSGGADPRMRMRASARRLQAAGSAVESLELGVDGQRSAHAITLHARDAALDLHASATGGLAPEWQRWVGRVETLENRAGVAFRLERPAALSASRSALALGPAELTWSGGRIALQDTVYTKEHLRSSGTAAGLPLRRLLTLAGVDLAWENTIALGARWQIEAGAQVDGRIEIFRESGDLVALTEEERLPMGLQQLALQASIVRNRVEATGTVTSSAAGTLSARGETVLSRRGGLWGVAGSAPAILEAEAKLDSVRALAAAFSHDVAVNARVQARLSARGTIADPRFQGVLSAQAIEVEHVATGVFLREGTLQAQFTPEAVRLERLRIRAGDGEFIGSGSYRLARQRLALEWSARQLAAVQMPDLLLVVSGSGKASAENGRIALTGSLRTDKGRVALRESTGAVLGEDVVVEGRESRPTMTGRVLRSKLDLRVDLGQDFRVSGRGLQASLGGQLHLYSAQDAPLRADGEIRVRSGTYEAYGRTLKIEDGTLLFAGAPDNPGLDILALRSNQQVQAGVRVTGTARRPVVQLVSIPDVPDLEKLAWLTLGRPLDPTSRADNAALQNYAAALAATLGTGNFQAQVAKAVGLDEIAVLPGTDPASEGGVVQIGKRIGERIYVVFEQRLSTAHNVLRVNYQLARDWSLRLESGETDAVDLFYTLSFD